MLYSGTDPESYITEYTFVYEENHGIPLTSAMNRMSEVGLARRLLHSGREV